MLNRFTLGLALCSLAFAVGCGNSSDGVKRAKYCTTDYKAVDLKVGGAKRKSLKPDDEFNMRAGEYSFNGMELYYNDQDRQIRFHIQLDKKGVQNSKSVLCVGGTGEDSFKFGMEPVIYSFSVVDKISVDESGKSLISFGTVTVDIRDRGDDSWFVITYDRDDKAVEGNLKDVYADYTGLEQYFYTFDKNAYQIRTHMRDPESDQKSKDKRLKIQSLTKFVKRDPTTDLVSF